MASHSSNGRNVRRFLLVVAGTALGMFFLYLTFRDISWNDFVSGLRQMKPLYLLPCALLVIFAQLARAFRFGLILRPICRLSLKDLWDLLNLWAAASMIMPARLGELVRPYLLRTRGASFSSGVGAVMVERFFDLSGLLVLLGLVLWTTPQVPRMYSFLGQALLLMLAVGYALVLLALAQREKADRIVHRLLSWLPATAASFLDEIFQRLLDGFGIMASFRQAITLFALSVMLWLVFSVLTYLFLLAFSVKAPFLVAVTIQVFICLGVALPSAPGFIGTFDAACRYALTLFGISAVVAVSFATVYHLFSFVLCLALGLVSYLTSDFRFDQAMFAKESEKGSVDGLSEAAEGLKEISTEALLSKDKPLQGAAAPD
ncbi:MAG: lysylphosphatidylglycerol synthase transmembrane domain-containing protein [Desulfomonilaceae bacterium]